MRQLVFDIETVGCQMQELSDSQQEYLLREANKERDESLRAEKAADAERFLSLYPFSAKVVAIGMYDVTSKRPVVYYESEELEEFTEGELDTLYKGMPEKEMLEAFWRVVAKVDQVITFNGRNFDLPFLMLRSAKLGVKPSKHFLGYRYDAKTHVDLLEQFTFYGITRKFNLDFYCHAFGVKSPKSKEVSGNEVKRMYEEGRVKDVARYCGDDIYATYRLFTIYEQFLKFS